MLTPDVPADIGSQEYWHTPEAHTMAVAAHADQPEADDYRPPFHLTALDGEDDLELIVATPTKPNIRKQASMALLFGLAVMTLDQDGTIEKRMHELLDKGDINEVDAVNRINLLLMKDGNVQRV